MVRKSVLEKGEEEGSEHAYGWDLFRILIFRAFCVSARRYICASVGSYFLLFCLV